MLLIVINLGLVWLLLAAPLGRRTIRLSRHLDAAPQRVWNALNPLGKNADWRASVVSTRAVAENRAVHVHSNLDRTGQPIEVVYQVEVDGNGSGYMAQVVEDTALDPIFWRNYREHCTLRPVAEGTDVLIERSDRYRGFAFLIFRYFSLRREMNALSAWLNDGRVKTGGIFEHPLTQFSLAVFSTILLWPFFGLNLTGLMLSSMLTVVIALHELGHMVAFRAFGHKRVRMVFIPLLGGIAIGGRPYNSRFEIAVCAIMGAGVSGFFVPLITGVTHAAENGWLTAELMRPSLVFLLILGAFNLLNLLPMQRFDGGQAIRQIFRTPTLQVVGSFLISGAILFTGWEIGLPREALMTALAVFALLSFMVKSGAKPRHAMMPMSDPERLMAGLGLYAAVLIHAYAIIRACSKLFA
nr:hypothetical protein [Rhizobium sp. L1K21]